MNYRQVRLAGFGYELAPHVLTSEDIEDRLSKAYAALHLQKGQLALLTGIEERRYWGPGMTMHEGAVRAAEKALEHTGIDRKNIGMLLYAGVCRDQLEPATACAVAHDLGLSPRTQVHDISNACLGVLNGMVHAANAIELGQIDAGLIVSCETSKDIMDRVIDRLNEAPDMALFRKTVATLTGGSGAVAVILCRATGLSEGHRLLGGVIRNAVQWHRLCCWGPDTGFPSDRDHFMETDSIGVLQNGVQLGIDTYRDFLAETGWCPNGPDKVVCHQVGAAHQRAILDALKIAPEKEFSTFAHLGNMGTVSLPMTAAIADEREFFEPGDRVGFLGIGSGLNCLMLALRW